MNNWKARRAAERAVLRTGDGPGLRFRHTKLEVPPDTP